jgi:tetratricopeptide (TPR) repeat protein
MRSSFQLRIALLVVAVVLLGGRVSLADELSEFEKGRNSYSVGRYEEAAERFAQMLDSNSDDPLTSPQLIEQARIYRAASLLAIGRLAEADHEIETILRTNPSAYPDPVVFPGIVLDRFTDVRGRIRQELESKAQEKARQEQLRLQREHERRERERERVAALEKIAQQETHTEHHSRWLAALPFGVGQFQNDQTALAWTLLVTETALATTTVVTSAVVQNLQSKGTEPNVDPIALNERVSTTKTINHVVFAAWVLTAAGGIAHAQWTFVPERKHVRKRELPPELRPAPTIGVVPGGALLEWRAQF